jgi:hypothetical protein
MLSRSRRSSLVSEGKRLGSAIEHIVRELRLPPHQ